MAHARQFKPNKGKSRQFEKFFSQESASKKPACRPSHRLLITDYWFTFFACLLSLCARAESPDQTIARATAAIEAATPRAQADPAHPIFHVTAPAQWINDPNGPIFYGGYYHLFYQLHPFSDESGPKFWGHVRSRDLAKWEPLPIALAPASESGEAEVWSGCCTTNGRGEPMIFYTSIAPGKSPQTHAEQWAAIGDRDLIKWQKSPANPVLSEALHGDRKIYEWRDPFIFHEASRTFLVTGGNLNETKGGQAVVNIYEAKNSDLTQWNYRGLLFTLPDASSRTAECPNFFRLGNKWVLFVSPYGKVQYFVGDFDAETCRFTSQTRGLLDYGPGFYAPNTMQVPDGRRLVWGWVNGFPGGHGWNGCLSLPRLLSLSRDGDLRQSPAPELSKLRGTPVEWRNIPLDGADGSWAMPKTNAIEILAEIDAKNAESITLVLKSGNTNNTPLLMKFNHSGLNISGSDIPFKFANGGKIEVRLFLDRSVLEVFVNDTVCFTQVVPLPEGGLSLEVRAEGTAEAKLIKAWPMEAIW